MAGKSGRNRAASLPGASKLRWLSATTLASSLLAASPAFAQATSGGAGGSPSTAFANGGASSATGMGSDGGNAPVASRGAGGGGAGTMGGAGGSDLTGTVFGGGGGFAPGATGSNGHNGDGTHGGGGGGGGAHGAVVTIDASNSATIAGGTGGRGGSTPGNYAAGGGGAGGYGVVLDGIGLTYTNDSTGIVSGGRGGAGGAASAGSGFGGNGGDGGYGVFLTGSGVVLNNAGTISGGNGGNGGDALSSPLTSAGGDGGRGGAGVYFAGAGTLINTGSITGGTSGNLGQGQSGFPLSFGQSGAAGDGVRGADLTIVNSGTISAGQDLGAVIQPNAITFTGGPNVLEIWAGSVINGNVVGTGTDTLRLGGASNSNFDVSALGATAQYQGFSHFVKTGTGTWTLTGSTTAATPWSINQGTLAVSSDASLGAASGGLSFDGGAFRYLAGFSSNRTVTLNAGGATFDTYGNNATLGGPIGGAGGLTKTGAGVLTLSGTSSYAGATVVNGGVLDVEGAITNTSGVSVNAGGTLAGAGLIDPPMTVSINAGATLAPGNGTAGSSMTIVGNLAFQSGATYLVQLDPGTASFASVSGSATLGGAGVVANFATGSYVDRTYTILTAGGGIIGSFGTLIKTNLPTNFKASLSYGANDVYLNLVLAFALPGGLNGNQQAVGSSLSAFFDRSGAIPLVFGFLNQAGLTQASGETATGAQQTTFNAMSQFTGLLTDPSAQHQDGAEDVGRATAFARMDRARTRTDAFAMLRDERPASLAQRWNVWAAGFGGSQFTTGSTLAGSNDTTSRLAGTAVGADYRLAPGTIAGFALAGGGTSFSVNGLGSGRSDLFQAGAYLRHHAGPRYLAAALAYGWQDVTTDRTVTISGIDRLRATFQANAWTGRLESGYRFLAPLTGGFGLTPYAAAQVTAVSLPAYAEQAVSGSSIFALNYAAKSVTDTRSELGFRADRSFVVQDGVLTLRGRAAWAHDFNPNRAVAATFQALPGASFVVNGAAQASESALATASAEWKWLSGVSLAATFEGEFSNVTRSYAGKGIARYQW